MKERERGLIEVFEIRRPIDLDFELSHRCSIDDDDDDDEATSPDEGEIGLQIRRRAAVDRACLMVGQPRNRRSFGIGNRRRRGTHCIKLRDRG